MTPNIEYRADNVNTYVLKILSIEINNHKDYKRGKNEGSSNSTQKSFSLRVFSIKQINTVRTCILYEHQLVKQLHI